MLALCRVCMQASETSFYRASKAKCTTIKLEWKSSEREYSTAMWLMSDDNIEAR